MKFIFFILSVLFFNCVFSQAKDSVGYIEYVHANGTSDIQTLQMWFTKKTSLSTYRPTSARLWPVFLNKKYSNVADSLNDDKKIRALDSSLMKKPTDITLRNISDVFFIRSYIINGNRYCLYDTVATRNWQLKPDTQTIAGFKCLKADFTFRSGEKGYAWYTPDIPLPYGPETLYGLPGLIIEVGSYESVYKTTIQKIEIPYTGAINMQACVNSKFITKNEYDNIMNENNQDFEKMLQLIEKQKSENQQ